MRGSVAQRLGEQTVASAIHRICIWRWDYYPKIGIETQLWCARGSGWELTIKQFHRSWPKFMHAIDVRWMPGAAALLDHHVSYSYFTELPRDESCQATYPNLILLWDLMTKSCPVTYANQILLRDLRTKVVKQRILIWFYWGATASLKTSRRYLSRNVSGSHFNE